MAKYEVTYRRSGEFIYEIEADTPEEAKEVFWDKYYHWLKEYGHTATVWAFSKDGEESGSVKEVREIE